MFSQAYMAFLEPATHVCLFFDKELDFEEGQSLLLLEKYSTVPAVLAACADVGRGEITHPPLRERTSAFSINTFTAAMSM